MSQSTQSTATRRSAQLATIPTGVHGGGELIVASAAILLLHVFEIVAEVVLPKIV
jgi:hypothetical protein